MSLTTLPNYILHSDHLTSSEKEKLASAAALPDEVEIQDFRNTPEIFDLLNAFIGDEHSRLVNLELMAKRYLKEGDIHSAWMCLLLY